MTPVARIGVADGVVAAVIIRRAGHAELGAVAVVAHPRRIAVESGAAAHGAAVITQPSALLAPPIDAFDVYARLLATLGCAGAIPTKRLTGLAVPAVAILAARTRAAGGAAIRIGAALAGSTIWRAA